jgi:SAM-dependent methyltransferase
MSYKLYSFKTGEEHDLDQWNGRSLRSEVESIRNRTLVEIFNRFLTGTRLRILEGGCGLGGWVDYFRKQGHDVIGIEYDERIIKLAKEEDPSIPIILGDITQLDFPDNSFDAYISLGVIEHFEHGPHQALTEAFRILKPGGLAFITTPVLTTLRRLVAHPMRDVYFRIRDLKGQPKYFWEYRFTKKELCDYIRDAGFEIEYVGIDDYEPEERHKHIGLWADYFFLRDKSGRAWELNGAGRAILRLLRVGSPWFFCSGAHVVARAPKRQA